ncbi:MAG: RidA family protein [Thaumarchaeota archaeon]|nr:RidA family protein [Nitrososphaerota archaeon]
MKERGLKEINPIDSLALHMDKLLIDSPEVASGGSMYSQAVKAGNVLYVSGQVAFDQKNALIGKGDIEAQTVQAFENMKALLKAAGMGFDNVVKITVYLTDLANRPSFHRVRERYFDSDKLPSSTLVVVKSLAHPDLLVEIEAVAVE